MNLDKYTNLFMQGVENPSLTSFSKFIDVVLDPTLLTIVSVLIATLFFIKGKKKQSIFLVSMIGVTTILIKSLKWIFSRPRPISTLMVETSYSFPSGHATIAVVFFGVLAFLILDNIRTKKKLQKIKFPLILSTVVIILVSGFSRIYLRVHWLTDVIAGFVLGGIIFISGIIIYKKLKI